MSDLGDLLELLHTADRRYRTVRATIREWRHHERAHRAFVRYAEERGGTMYAQITTLGRAPETYETLTRIWSEKPDRVREEREGEHAAPELGIRDGRRWWMYGAEIGAVSNDDDTSVGSGVGEAHRYLFEPARLLGALELEPLDRVEVAGRAAIRARATARPHDERDSELALGYLGHGADEYELAVDAERGVLLRTTALLDGEPFAVAEVPELAFDEEFPRETFVFVPPPGADVRPAGRRRGQHVSIEQAAELAPFTVYVPARVPADWRMRVVYFPSDERPPIPPSVSLLYVPDDATHQVSLHETPVEGTDPEADLPWARREAAGDKLLVWDPGDSPGGRRRVRVERDGTRVDVSSDLELETVVALARSLVPARTEPPRVR